MRNNYRTINVETKKNRVNKMTKFDLIYLEFTIQYVTLTSYYIIKDTLMRSNDSNIHVEIKSYRVK